MLRDARHRWGRVSLHNEHAHATCWRVLLQKVPKQVLKARRCTRPNALGRMQRKSKATQSKAKQSKAKQTLKSAKAKAQKWKRRKRRKRWWRKTTKNISKFEGCFLSSSERGIGSRSPMHAGKGK